MKICAGYVKDALHLQMFEREVEFDMAVHAHPDVSHINCLAAHCNEAHTGQLVRGNSV